MDVRKKKHSEKLTRLAHCWLKECKLNVDVEESRKYILE